MRLNGFTLVELLVAIAIAGILFALGVPEFRTIIDSTKSKAAAESILSGLRFAKSEAIKRNTLMRFQLVSTLDNACILSTSSVLWVVNQEESRALQRSPATKCASATVNPNTGDVLVAANPYIAFKSDGKVYNGIAIDVPGAANSTDSVVTFGPLGQVISNLDGSATMTEITVTPNNPDAKTWSVRIQGANGSIKICDPNPASRLACS